MAEFEYHPDICSACLRPIEPEEPIVIIDDVKEPPRYYHEKCLFESFELIQAIHGYPKNLRGANDEKFD